MHHHFLLYYIGRS